jgi:HPt (histidine-containing phosphotransfer) domain-containing protein
MESFIGAGMDDFLSKPIDPRALNSVLLKWLHGKITTSDGPYKGGQKDGEYDELMSELARIEGLDAAKGIKSVGGEKGAYISILRQARDEMLEYAESIRASCRDENWRDYAIRTHAMKSALANIGADGLSARAYELETAAVNGDAEKCVKETDAMCDDMLALHRALLGTSLGGEDEERDQAEKTPRDAAFIAQKLEQLKEASMYGKSDEAEETAEELAKAGFDKKTEDDLLEIRRLVKSYDYEKVIDLAEALAAYLSAPAPTRD